MSRKLTVITIVIAIFFTLTILGGLIWANASFVKSQPTEKRFLIPWLAAKTYLNYGINPYADQATQRAQIVFYGRLSTEKEDPLKLSTPMPMMIFYFPFALIEDYSIARGVWMTLGEISIVIGIWLCILLTSWKPRRFLLITFLLFSIFSVYCVKTLLDGSPVAFIFTGFLGALAVMRNKKDELAGALLVLAMLKPTLSPLFLVFIFWWTASQRRWHVWYGFLITAGFLVGLSFFLLPDWFLPFLRGLIAYNRNDPGITVAGLLSEWWPSFGFKLSLALTACVGLMLFLEWRILRGIEFRHVVWTVSLILSAWPLIGIPTSLESHIFLLLPLALILSVTNERWMKMGAALMMAGLLIGAFIFLWLVSGKISALFLLPPGVLIAGLYWIRWWAIHPPRTWVETSP
jgi:hypothetical protein